MTHAIGNAAKLSGVNIETIRYYEREGIVPKAKRAENGRRTYDEDAISRLRFVKRCRELGFAIVDIRTLLRLSDQDAGTCDEVRNLSEMNLAAVSAKIEDLVRMQNALQELITSCRSGQTECPMLRNLFAE
ncbi:MAG: MerR family transcriptional regulator [Lentilitoribacter sp.]